MWEPHLLPAAARPWRARRLRFPEPSAANGRHSERARGTSVGAGRGRAFLCACVRAGAALGRVAGWSELGQTLTAEGPGSLAASEGQRVFVGTAAPGRDSCRWLLCMRWRHGGWLRAVPSPWSPPVSRLHMCQAHHGSVADRARNAGKTTDSIALIREKLRREQNGSKRGCRRLGSSALHAPWDFESSVSVTCRDTAVRTWMSSVAGSSSLVRGRFSSVLGPVLQRAASLRARELFLPRLVGAFPMAAVGRSVQTQQGEIIGLVNKEHPVMKFHPLDRYTRGVIDPS